MMISGLANLVSKSDDKAALEVAGRPVFELNSVAVIIWEHLAAGIQTEEIVSQLVERFHIPEKQAANDVTNFLELLREHLLVLDDVDGRAATTDQLP